MFILLTLKLSYLGVSYYKYSYENGKEGKEVRDAEKQNFLCTWPSDGAIKFLAEQKKSQGQLKNYVQYAGIKDSFLSSSIEKMLLHTKHRL